MFGDYSLAELGSILVMQGFAGSILFSVFLLMALGLAIIFGQMGVINMAHGEFMILGAYMTYLVLASVRDTFSRASTAVLFLCDGDRVRRRRRARPAGRMAAHPPSLRPPARHVARDLGLSLIMQQAFRSTFGAREVGVELPQWMMGSLPVAGSIEVQINGLFVMGLTLSSPGSSPSALQVALGLQVRAVVSNRTMSGAVGIDTRRIDMLTFGLGCGIAGVAGSAFTMIGSTGPTAGQLYIVDTFLVVVFGGAQSLLGTVASAFTISQSQSTLEFFLTGSMAKVLTLLMVIGLLMLRPQGLFVLKVRRDRCNAATRIDSARSS
jgi:urea transport system permease protein